MRIAILDDNRNAALATVAWQRVAEPLSAHHALRTIPKVIRLPHLSHVAEETYHAFYQGAVEDIEAWRDGASLRVLTP